MTHWSRDRYAICLLLPACVLLGLAPPALTQVPQVEFRNVRDIRSSPIATRPAVGSPPIVREQQSSPGSARRPTDPSLGPPIARLGLDSRGLLAATEIPVGETLQSGSPLVEFAIGNYFLRMAIVERVVDRNFDAVHYTLVDPDSADYARLTIAAGGTEITGTLFRDREEYRILPETDAHQLVHPVVRYRGEFRRAGGPDLETRAGRLEARHLQMAWVAERRPLQFRTTTDGRLSSFESGPGGVPVLGRIDIFAAMQPAPDGKSATDAMRLSAAVVDFLDDIRHLTLLDDSVQLTTGASDLNGIFEGRANQAELVFEQLIDGISTVSVGRVLIDRTGNVLNFSGTLRHPSTAERGRNLISQQEAEATALDAFRERIGVDLALDVHSSELHYVPSADNLNLVWRTILRLNGCNQGFIVDVRALTGNVERIDLNALAGRPDGEDVLAALRAACARSRRD